MTNILHRTSEREDLTDGMRIRLLEGDADSFESQIAGLSSQLTLLNRLATSILISVVLILVNSLLTH